MTVFSEKCGILYFIYHHNYSFYEGLQRCLKRWLGFELHHKCQSEAN